jgi:predicted Zn-dependent protease
MRKFLVVVTLLSVLPAQAKHCYYEKDYQKVWCDSNKGVMEVRLPDAARADCVTSEYAVEVDFAQKWAESIGQSLYYAAVLKKKPGVLLIIENGENDDKFLKRLQIVANLYNIRIWTITPDDIPNRP